MSFTSTAMMMGNSYPPFLVPTAAPASVGGASSGSTVISNASTVTPVGGSGQRTYAWRRTLGSTSINAVSPNSASTTFQATGMSIGALPATFVCDVTDVVTGEMKTSNPVTIYLERGYPGLSISGPAAINVYTPSPNSITVSGSTSISISGGSGSYATTWFGSGDFTVSGSGSSGSASRLLGPTGGVSGTISCRVRDLTTGEEQTVSAGVVLVNNGTPPSPPIGSISPNPGTATSSDSNIPIYLSASASGGSGSYQFNWSNGTVGASATYWSGPMGPNELRYGSASVQVTDLVTGLASYPSVSLSWYQITIGPIGMG